MRILRTKQTPPVPVPINIWDTKIDDERQQKCEQERHDFLYNRFGRPISIPPVELGAVESPQIKSVVHVDSVQPHSIAEAHLPQNPYAKVKSLIRIEREKQ